MSRRTAFIELNPLSGLGRVRNDFPAFQQTLQLMLSSVLINVQVIRWSLYRPISGGRQWRSSDNGAGKDRDAT